MIEPDVEPAVRRCVQTLLEHRVIASADYRRSVASTNTAAVDWLRSRPAGASTERTPRLVLTDEQTAGRGRRGRSWFAATDGLACSLILPAASPLVPIAVGVAIAQTIEDVAGPTRCGLKWPNDVWMQDQKVAGILIERIDQASAMLVIGVGINLQTVPMPVDPSAPTATSGAPVSSAVPATSIMHATGRVLSRSDLLGELVPAILRCVIQCQQDPDVIRASFDSRCRLSGHPVETLLEGQRRTGVCRGIDPEGHLLVETATGMQSWHTGEVQRVRPSLPPPHARSAH